MAAAPGRVPREIGGDRRYLQPEPAPEGEYYCVPRWAHLLMQAAFAGLTIDIEGLEQDVEAALSAKLSCKALLRATDAALSFIAGAAHDFKSELIPGVEETFELAFGRALEFSGRLVRGSFDGRAATCVIAPVPVADQLGAIENVLRITTAQLIAARGGLLLHSAAIAQGDEAIVLVGHSGAGKSTLSATAKKLGRRVLSDELNAVFPDATGGCVVCPVPFAGDFGEPPTDERLHVRGLYLLEQGVDGVRPVTRARAAGTLLAASPFVNTDLARTDSLLTTALALAGRTHVRAMSLSLGGDAWAVAESAR